VKGYFNREFIQKDIFLKEFGRIYNKAFEYRQKFDYVDLVSPEPEMITDYIDSATEFVDKIKAYLEGQKTIED